MPPRSKVITMLPAHIRQEIERRLLDNGFRDYEGLAQWVRGQGYEISDDSLWRYGHSLQKQLAAARLTLHATGSLAEQAGEHEPSMLRALMALAQQRVFETLAQKEDLKPSDVNAIANLVRAAIAQQRWNAELKPLSKSEQEVVHEGSRPSNHERPSQASSPTLAPRDPRQTQVPDTQPKLASRGGQRAASCSHKSRRPADPQSQDAAIPLEAAPKRPSG
jgi:hypothetical protein